MPSGNKANPSVIRFDGSLNEFAGGSFYNPFFMKYRLEILKPIKAEETEIGVGAPVFLRCVSPPMIKLLRKSYLEDNTCMKGDIEFLFEFDGIGVCENDKYYRP